MRKFKRDVTLIALVLKKLDKHFNLKGKYVEVYLVNDRTMKKNVLSFPAPKNFPRPDINGYQSLGEIYLNPGYIKRHKENLIRMLVHGLLHLLGYDHKKEGDRMKMDKKEEELSFLWRKIS